MVVHKKDELGPVADYYVTAQITEPKYGTEWKFLDTELAYVERKLVAHSTWGWNWISRPSLGLYSHNDWLGYQRQLRQYAKSLEKYADEVHEGVLPLMLSVHNDMDQADNSISVKVHVKHGRIDEHRKAPERPQRLDSRSKGWPKISVPNPLAFSRRGIKITEHLIRAELSGLAPHAGAGVINQLVHIHTSIDTEVTYEIKSHNVSHEMGEVGLQEVAQPGHKPDSST